MILISTPLEEYRVELIARLKTKDAAHAVYETVLPPANVSHPFYYIEEIRAPDNRTRKQALTQDVYHTVSVWHDNPDEIGDVLRMLGTIGEVIGDMEREGTHSFIWTTIDTAMRCMADNISGQIVNGIKTKYVHGIFEIHMQQIGFR